VHPKEWAKDEPKQVCLRGFSWRILAIFVHEGGIEVGKKSMKAIDEVVPPTNLKSCNHCLARSIL
jgi:hypothetical protein